VLVKVGGADDGWVRLLRGRAAADEFGEYSIGEKLNSMSWTRRLSSASVVVPCGRRGLRSSVVRRDPGWYGARGPIGLTRDVAG
jgi:hypothetical protein